MSLHSEIFEQPQTLANLLEIQWPLVQQVAKDLRKRDIRYVFLAARGTSDNAGRYAQYLWGAHNRLPLALATPSLFTHYHQPPTLKNALVVGISQSGVSPDIIEVLAEGRRQGCPTLVIINNPEGPLAIEAEYVIDIKVGPELAVAATKTYTGELCAIAMLSVAMQDGMAGLKDLQKVPQWADMVLGEDNTIYQMVERYRYMNQCVVLGRGFNYSTAFEWALKLKELTYIKAEPYSTADFRHGPIAIVEDGFPVLVVAPEGDVLPPIFELIEQLRKRQMAELVIISNSTKVLHLAQSSIRIPGGIPEWITPIIAIIPGQLFTMYLTKSKGYNTEQPRFIKKVTETV